MLDMNRTALAADVPTPAANRVIIFVDDQGRIASKLADGTILQSAKGDKGDTGAAGAPGAAGAQGVAGAQGAQGAPGAKGDTGAPGAQGAPGAAGVAGAPGAAGAKGDKGDKGDPGVVVTNETATLNVARPGNAAGLGLAQATSQASLIGKRVKATAYIKTQSTGATNLTFVLSVGGLMFSFSPFSVSGARAAFVQAEAFITSANAGSAFGLQGSGAQGATASGVFSPSLATSGAVASQTVDLIVTGANVTITTQQACVEIN